MFIDPERTALTSLVNRDGWAVAERRVVTTPGYLEVVKVFLERNGSPVALDGNGLVNFYGWTNYAARHHTATTETCGGWALHPDALVEERDFDQFDDTLSPAITETGVQASPASCWCGMYTNVTLRWTGSMRDLLRMLLAL